MLAAGKLGDLLYSDARLREVIDCRFFAMKLSLVALKFEMKLYSSLNDLD